MRLDGLGLYEKGGLWNTSREVEYFEIVMIAAIGGGRFKPDKMYGKVFEILWERHDVKQLKCINL
jgi:hypothetical protein